MSFYCYADGTQENIKLGTIKNGEHESILKGNSVSSDIESKAPLSIPNSHLFQSTEGHNEGFFPMKTEDVDENRIPLLIPAERLNGTRSVQLDGDETGVSTQVKVQSDIFMILKNRLKIVSAFILLTIYWAAIWDLFCSIPASLIEDQLGSNKHDEADDYYNYEDHRPGTAREEMGLFLLGLVLTGFSLWYMVGFFNNIKLSIFSL